MLAAGALPATLAAFGCGRLGFDSELPSAADGGPDATTERVFAGEGEIEDTGLEAFVPEVNCGRCDAVNGGNAEAGLFRIDLARVSSGASVRSARLELWLATTFTPGGTNDAFVVREEWDEGDLDAADGAASWNLRLPGVPWTTEGAGPGSRDSDPFATFTPIGLDEPIAVDVPPAIVKAWIDRPGENFGIAIVGRGYSDVGADHPHFVSTESDLAADRGPRLTVVFDSL